MDPRLRLAALLSLALLAPACAPVAANPDPEPACEAPDPGPCWRATAWPDGGGCLLHWELASWDDECVTSVGWSEADEGRVAEAAGAALVVPRPPGVPAPAVVRVSLADAPPETDEGECLQGETCGDPDVPGECACRVRLSRVRAELEVAPGLRGPSRLSLGNGSAQTSYLACCAPLEEWRHLLLFSEGDGAGARRAFGVTVVHSPE